MSEQDFFFDEEPDSKGPGSKDAKGPAPKQGMPKQGAPKGGSKPSGSSPSKAAPVVETSNSVADQSTTWAVASLLGVIGLLLGAILGFMLGSSLGGVAPSTTTPPPTAPATSGQPSTLTSDQINSGQLPAGHPQIDASGSAGASGTPGQ